MGVASYELSDACKHSGANDAKAIALTYSMTEVNYMPQSLITDRSSLNPREGPGDEAKTDPS